MLAILVVHRVLCRFCVQSINTFHENFFVVSVNFLTSKTLFPLFVFVLLQHHFGSPSQYRLQKQQVAVLHQEPSLLKANCIDDNQEAEKVLRRTEVRNMSAIVLFVHSFGGNLVPPFTAVEILGYLC